MTRFAAWLAVALLVAPQEPAERTVEEELEALIEKTNAIESFHAVYDMESSLDEGTWTMELVYRAPDLGRLRASSSSGDVDYWIVGDRMLLNQDEQWKSATFVEPEVNRVLSELFPPEDKPLEAGVAVVLTLAREASGKGQFAVSMRHVFNGRTCVLGWLEKMLAWPGVTAEGSSLRWEDDGLRCQVSRETGLLEEVEITSEDGHMLVRLRQGEVDVTLEEELVTLPSEAEDAPIDAGLSASLDLHNDWRRMAFLRVEHVVATGKRPWSELVRNDWREVLDAMHRDQVDEGYAEWRAATLEGIETMSDHVRSERAEDDSPEHLAEVRQQVAEGRAKLDETLARGESTYLERLPEIEGGRIEPRDELFETEKEVVAELWNERMREPILAAFDEAMEDALER